MNQAISVVSAPQSAALTESELSPWEARLEGFPDHRVHRFKGVTAPGATSAWPRFEGCLVMLFIARSGSSFLSTELEQHYDIGRMGEHLNKYDLIRDGRMQRKSRRIAGQWFSFKASIQGIITAEASGFTRVNLDRMHFLRLVRRDIVAQAISRQKARQTKQWHTHAEALAEPAYNLGELEWTVERIASGVDLFRQYVERTGRPSRQVVYEDLLEGSLAAAFSACDSLGAPRRIEDIDRVRSVERMPRDVADEWRQRFLDEAGSKTLECIDRYQKSLEA